MTLKRVLRDFLVLTDLLNSDIGSDSRLMRLKSRTSGWIAYACLTMSQFVAWHLGAFHRTVSMFRTASHALVTLSGVPKVSPALSHHS